MATDAQRTATRDMRSPEGSSDPRCRRPSSVSQVATGAGPAPSLGGPRFGSRSAVSLARSLSSRPSIDPLQELGEALAQRYAFERELGRGGMATVYLARDLRHDRPVALKVLHSELATT